MKIVLTGASGFLGQNFVAAWGKSHQIFTLGRDAKNDIAADLSREIPAIPPCDIVVHAAGKAHSIPKTDEERKAFFDVNMQGTKNVLAALESRLPKRFVLISTVAVYGIESGTQISEDAPLKGDTPYAQSKIEAEKLVEKWALKNNVEYLILRLPLISGHNPPGNLGAMAKAIKKGFYMRIGKAAAQRSMVGAADVARLIAQENWQSGIYNLTDGMHPSIAQTEERIAKTFDKKVKTIPLWSIQLAAKVGDFIPKFPLNSARLSKLQNTLTFSDDKARTNLGWNPQSALLQLTFERSK